MSFINSKSLLTVLCISLLSLHLVKAQAIQGEAVRGKLRSISPIQIDIEGVTLIEAVERLKNITSAKGMSEFNVLYDLSSQPGLAERTANLYLENINADFAFEQILQTFGVAAIYDNYAIRLIPTQGNNVGFISKKWQVPPVFFKNLAEKTAGDPSAFNTVSVQKPIDILKQLGVSMPEGSSVIYLASSNFLEVRAPVQSIDIIDKLVIEAKQKEASQVSLRIKYVVINQDELDELGFDWVTGGFTNITGGAAISDTVNDNLLDVTTNLTSTPTQALTAGNRTITELGEFNSALETIVGDLTRIEQGSAKGERTPGVLSYIQNFESSKQATVMLRALSQAKSFDVMEAPHVVVKSGQQGTFFKGGEIKYPTAYEQAEISESGGDFSVDILTGEIANIIPSNFSVKPSHPTDFETQKLGLELKVTPNLSANNQLINLNINPKFYEFQGFLSFGERILNVAYNDELYIDRDLDGIILVGEDSTGKKVVIENVLGGVANSIILFDNDLDGLIDGVQSITNSITATETGAENLQTNLAVTNRAGNVENYRGLFIYFNLQIADFINNNAGIGLPNSSENGSGLGFANGQTFDTIDLDKSDGIRYQASFDLTVSPFSVLADIGFIYFVDPNDYDVYEATPNYVVQPIFDKTELNTQATIQSGETVLLGGLLQQNKITLDDSLPLLGDIPLAGRLFKNEGEDVESKAILIFIEAIAQDPLGNPVAN